MSGTLRSSLAEFAGTFALVWLSASAACSAGPLGAALAYGLAWAMLAYVFDTDAHFNPAFTAGLFFTRRLDGIRAVFLAASQLLGAGLAGTFLVRTFHARALPGVCGLTGVGFRMGTLVEAMTTFFVAFAFCAGRLGKPRDASGCAFLGAAAAAASLGTSGLTGGAFNPARAFGPAVAAGQWDNWYVYWAGPMVGAAAAALLHEKLFQEKK